MSRITTPADVMAGCLPQLMLAGPVLLAGEASLELTRAVAALGLISVTWLRRSSVDHPGSPWPLPAREEQDMSLHAALSVLRPGGRLLVYGANDEGIKPLAGRLVALTGAAETIATQAHARVLAAARPELVPGLRANLVDWRRTWSLAFGAEMRDWVSYPGVFADGRLDAGTALLLAHLPALAAGDAILDYGCGGGIVAANVLARQSSTIPLGLTIDMLDPDSAALLAAAANVPAARPILGTSLATVAGRRYRAILSNPPLHDGHAEDHGVLERLIAGAPAHLVKGGELRLVVQRRIPLDRLLDKSFRTVEIVAETSRFRVWRAAVPRA